MACLFGRGMRNRNRKLALALSITFSPKSAPSANVVDQKHGVQAALQQESGRVATRRTRVSQRCVNAKSIQHVVNKIICVTALQKLLVVGYQSETRPKPLTQSINTANHYQRSLQGNGQRPIQRRRKRRPMALRSFWMWYCLS